MQPLISIENLGAALRAKRRAAGLTQAELAERAGCRRQTVLSIESGESAKTHVLLGLLAALGLGLAVVDAEAGPASGAAEESSG